MAKLSKWKRDLISSYHARIHRLEHLNDVNFQNIRKLRAKIDHLEGKGYIIEEKPRGSNWEIIDDSRAIKGD